MNMATISKITQNCLFIINPVLNPFDPDDVTITSLKKLARGVGEVNM